MFLSNDHNPSAGMFDDGVDPRGEFRHGVARRRAGRKTLQLCRQVAETLSQVLAGECDDELLLALQVVAVRPAPDGSQLLVTVGPLLPDEPLDPFEAVARLNAASGRLRAAVAASITRRRAPKLLFRYASP